MEYLKHRRSEEKTKGNSIPDKSGSRQGVSESLANFKTDAILTQTTVLLASLHRAILRNWHQLLLLMANLAGDGSSRINNRLNTFQPHDLTRIECKIEVPGVPHHTVTPCLKGEDWIKDSNCVSPIKNPSLTCSPREHNSNFQVVHGQQVLTIGHPGVWRFCVQGLVLAEDNNHEFVTNDVIVGSIDKITSKGTQRLTSIDHAVHFNKDEASQGLRTQFEVDGKVLLKVGDKILFRLGKAKSNMRIKFNANFTGNNFPQKSLTKNAQPLRFKKAKDEIEEIEKDIQSESENEVEVDQLENTSSVEDVDVGISTSFSETDLIQTSTDSVLLPSVTPTPIDNPNNATAKSHKASVNGIVVNPDEIRASKPNETSEILLNNKIEKENLSLELGEDDVGSSLEEEDYEEIEESQEDLDESQAVVEVGGLNDVGTYNVKSKNNITNDNIDVEDEEVLVLKK